MGRRVEGAACGGLGLGDGMEWAERGRGGREVLLGARGFEAMDGAAGNRKVEEFEVF